MFFCGIVRPCRAAIWDKSPAAKTCRFALEVGVIPLTGTTNDDHMQADLEVFDFRLEPAEVERIEGLDER
jgi:diketogulonate reductase-like aldo/keto reductase